jgi:cell division protein FtsB
MYILSAKRKKEKRGLFFAKIFTFLVFSFLIFVFVSSLLKISKEKEKLSKEVSLLEQKKNELLKEKEKLEEMLNKEKNEFYVERNLRREGYIKKGEIPAVIVAQKEEINQKEFEPTQKENFFEKIKKIFSNFLRD